MSTRLFISKKLAAGIFTFLLFSCSSVFSSGKIIMINNTLHKTEIQYWGNEEKDELLPNQGFEIDDYKKNNIEKIVLYKDNNEVLYQLRVKADFKMHLGQLIDKSRILNTDDIIIKLKHLVLNNNPPYIYMTSGNFSSYVPTDYWEEL